MKRFILYLTILVPWVLPAQPQPGDVFREYVWTKPGAETEPFLRIGGDRDYRIDPGDLPFSAQRDGHILWPTVLDLDQVDRAELVIEKLLSHTGTTGFAVQWNEGEWQEIPEPPGIPVPRHDRPHFYNAVVPIDAKDLRDRDNTFSLRVDELHPSGQPQQLVYGVMLRVYYKPRRKDAVRGEILLPRSGETLPEDVQLVADLEGEATRIEYLAKYRDVNWAGDGAEYRWQYFFHRGDIRNIVAATDNLLKSEFWDTRWLPDQEEPIELAARIHAPDGLIYFTEPVTGLRLERAFSVTISFPQGQPTHWTTGTDRYTATLAIAGTPAEATAARIYWASWNPCHGAGIFLNGVEIYRGENDPCYEYSQHEVALPPTILRPGRNELVTAQSFLPKEESEQGMAVLYPGPTLKIRYGQPASPPRELFQRAPDRTFYTVIDTTVSKNFPPPADPVVLSEEPASLARPGREKKLVQPPASPPTPVGRDRPVALATREAPPPHPVGFPAEPATLPQEQPAVAEAAPAASDGPLTPPRPAVATNAADPTTIAPTRPPAEAKRTRNPESSREQPAVSPPATLATVPPTTVAPTPAARPTPTGTGFSAPGQASSPSASSYPSVAIAPPAGSHSPPSAQPNAREDRLASRPAVPQPPASAAPSSRTRRTPSAARNRNRRGRQARTVVPSQGSAHSQRSYTGMYSGSGQRSPFRQAMLLGDAVWQDYEVVMNAKLLMPPLGSWTMNDEPIPYFALATHLDDYPGAVPGDSLGATAEFYVLPEREAYLWRIVRDNRLLAEKMSNYPPLALGQDYRVKFRAEAKGQEILYRVKCWPEGGTEPIDWDLQARDPGYASIGGYALLLPEEQAISFASVEVNPIVSEVRILETEDEGQTAFRIETPGATYLYQGDAGGFSSIQDRNGNDWVDFHPNEQPAFPAAAAHAYRGLPNLVFGGPNDGAGHPGFAGCTSVRVDESRIRTTTLDGRWQWTWTFFDHYAELEVERIDPGQPYWFLYEGPPAGRWDPQAAFWFTDQGEMAADSLPDYYAGTSRVDQFRWAAFGQSYYDQIFYVAQRQVDEQPDLGGYLGNSPAGLEAPDGMVVFGFGRGADATPRLRRPERFVIGFTDQLPYTGVKEIIEGRLR